MSVNKNHLKYVDIDGQVYFLGKTSREDALKLVELHKMKEEGLSIAGMEDFILNLSEETVERLKSGVYTSLTIPKDEMVLGELRDYQTVGVAFLKAARRSLLTSVVGLGKTATVSGLCRGIQLSAMRKLKELGYEVKSNPVRMLFLTQAGLVTQAIDDLTKFTGFNFHKLEGIKASYEPFFNDFYEGMEHGLYDDWSVVASETILLNPRFLKMMRDYEEKEGAPLFNVIAIDEVSSKVKQRKTTATYKALEELINKYPHGHELAPQYVVTMTATPFEGNLEVMYNNIDLVRPDLQPAITRWREMYCEMEMRYGSNFRVPTGKYKNVDDYRNKVKLAMMGYTRIDIGAVSEDTTAVAVVTKLTKRQRQLAQMTSQKGLVYSAPMAIDESMGLDDISKLKALKLLCKSVLRNKNELALVFAHHHAAQKVLLDYLTEIHVPALIINGETDSTERDELLERFKRGEFQILITNLTRGFNIPQASHVIFYQIPRNPGIITQFIGRVTRAKDIVGKHLWILPTYGVDSSELDILNNVTSDLLKDADTAQGRDLSLMSDFVENPIFIDADSFDPDKEDIYELIAEGGNTGFDSKSSRGVFIDDGEGQVEVITLSDEEAASLAEDINELF